MGTDELFKKRRAARKKRQHDIRTPQANSYLIITEGTRTEPFYFKGLQKLIQETMCLFEMLYFCRGGECS